MLLLEGLQPVVVLARAAIQALLKGRRAEFLHKVVRILLDGLSLRVVGVGELEHPDVQVGVFQNVEHPVGGLLTRRVVVVAEHQLLGVAGQYPGVLLGEGGAHGGHHVVKPRLVEGDDIDVALHQHQIGPLGALGKVEGVDQPPLLEGNGLRGVEVLGPLLPRQDAAGEAGHLPPHVDDGEHETGAKLVVHAAVLARHGQPGVDELHLAVSLGGQRPGQRVPLLRSRPQAEAGGGARRNLPLGQIVPHPRTAGALEVVVVKPGRVPVGREGPGPLFAPGVIGACVRHLQPRPLGQQAHRVGKGQVLDLHDEGDHPAPFAAAEAVVNLFIRRNREGGRLFVVKGAQPPQVVSLPGQVDIGGNHVGDLAPGHQLVDELFGNRHAAPSFRLCFPQYTRLIPSRAACLSAPTSRSRISE